MYLKLSDQKYSKQEVKTDPDTHGKHSHMV